MKPSIKQIEKLINFPFQHNIR